MHLVRGRRFHHPDSGCATVPPSPVSSPVPMRSADPANLLRLAAQSALSRPDVLAANAPSLSAPALPAPVHSVLPVGQRASLSSLYCKDDFAIIIVTTYDALH